MARGDQLRRPWLILEAIAARRHTRRELAQELGVSRKTITRDIAALDMFPIVEERDGIDVSYQLLRGVRTPALHLEPEERAALTLAEPSMRRALEGSPWAETVDRALDKLRLIQRERADRVGHTLWSQLRPHILAHPQVTFVLIHFSLRHSDREVIEFFEAEVARHPEGQLDNLVVWASKEAVLHGQHQRGRRG